jgi:signal transduction histidine kinase
MVFHPLVGTRFGGYDTARLDPSTGVAALVRATGRPFRTDDLATDPRLGGDVEWHAREEGAVSELVVPIVVQGVAEGLIYLDNRSGRPFTERDESLALRLSALAAGAVANARLFAREQSASRAKDEFLAILGHELRNPLAALSNAVAVLSEIGWNRERSEPLRQIVTRQMRHLSHLLDDLLDVSRAVTGKLSLRREPVDLAEVVARCTAPFRQAGAAPGHRVTLRAEPVPVEADPGRLEQVVANLLDNAVKYTPEGGEILVEVTRDGDSAMLRVRDTGVGISADLLSRIFDPFTQELQAIDRSRGGLGLGLALVKRLAEMHGGSVAAHSEGPGRGSEFTVRLPLSRAPAAAPAAVGELPATRRRVLLIEDHADTRESLRLLLEQQGHEVEEAGDGIEGLEKLAATRPDVALIDVGLPGLDGYAIARAVRTRADVGAPYLVAVTGYGQAADRRRALEAGFDAHLVKPVGADDLRRALATGATPRPA